MKVSKAFDWYTQHPEELKKYAGKHIAIIDDQIVRVGNSAKEAYRTARGKYPDKTPLLTYIPKGQTLVL
jgi:hypothetical protein